MRQLAVGHVQFLNTAFSFLNIVLLHILNPILCLPLRGDTGNFMAVNWTVLC